MLPNQAQCNLDKTIMFLSGFSLEIIHTKYLWIFMDETETSNTTEKKVLGFQINGIGNGHITQANTLYNWRESFILSDEY